MSRDGTLRQKAIAATYQAPTTRLAKSRARATSALIDTYKRAAATGSAYEPGCSANRALADSGKPGARGSQLSLRNALATAFAMLAPFGTLAPVAILAARPPANVSPEPIVSKVSTGKPSTKRSVFPRTDLSAKTQPSRPRLIAAHWYPSGGSLDIKSSVPRMLNWARASSSFSRYTLTAGHTEETLQSLRG